MPQALFGKYRFCGRQRQQLSITFWLCLPQDTIGNGQNPCSNLGNDTKDQQPKTARISRMHRSASRERHDTIVLRQGRVGRGGSECGKKGSQSVPEQATLDALGMVLVCGVDTRGVFRRRDVTLTEETGEIKT